MSPPGRTANQVPQLSFGLNAQAVKEAELALKNRSSNTSENYSRAQTEYLAFIKRAIAAERVKPTEDGGSLLPLTNDTLVTPERLQLWVTRELCERERKSGKKLPDGTRGPLSPKTVALSIAGVVDLWVQQQTNGENARGNPRTNNDTLKKRLARYQVEYSQAEKEGTGDRGKARHTEVYGPEHHTKICAHTLMGANAGKVNKSVYLALRLFQTAQWSLCLRSVVTVEAEFAHIATSPLSTSEGQAGFRISMDIRNDKGQLAGVRREMACMRHTNWETCTHSSFSFWFFWRLRISGEKFPNFRTREWIKTPIFYNTRRTQGGNRRKAPGDDDTVEAPLPAEILAERIADGFDYEMAYKMVKEAYADLHITLPKVTHATRGGAARSALDNGVAEVSIQSLGRWADQSALRNNYLTGFPVEALRVNAGHPRLEGTYYVPRADMIPPASLVDQVFPELNEWVEVDGVWPEDIRPYVQEQDTQDFIRTLAYLRIVLLQDAALLRERKPDHWMLKHELFQSQEFITFSDEVISHCGVAAQADEPLTRTTLSRFAPEIAAAIRDATSRVLARQDVGLAQASSQSAATLSASTEMLSEFSDMKQMLMSLAGRFDDLERRELSHVRREQDKDDFELQEARHRAATLRLELQASTLEVERLEKRRTDLYSSSIDRTEGSGSGSAGIGIIAGSSAGSSSAGSSLGVAGSAPTPGSTGSTGSAPTPGSASSAAGQQSGPTLPEEVAMTPPPFDMGQPTRISELTRVWWVPHGPYNTCVDILERQWGNKWRPTTIDAAGKKHNARSRYYTERVPLMEEVHRRALLAARADGRDKTAVADEVAAAQAMELELESLPGAQRTVNFQMKVYSKAKREKGRQT